MRAVAHDHRMSRRHFGGAAAWLFAAHFAPVALLSDAHARARRRRKAPKSRISAVMEDPRAIIIDIYKTAAGPEGKYTGPSAFQDERIRRLYFSKSLLAAVTAMEKKERSTSTAILGFDPITNSPDPDVKNLSIVTEVASADKATVAATFWSYNDKQPSIIRYDLITEAGAWRLDEIRGENHNDKVSPFWSLRKLIGG